MSTTKIAIGVLPNLWPVIQWLEGGCDPKEAAKELRLYAERIDQGGAPVIASAAPAPVVPADSRDQALGLYVAQAEAICALLDKHAPDTHGNLQTRLAQALTRGSRIDADKLHRDARRALADAAILRAQIDPTKNIEAAAAANNIVRFLRGFIARHVAAELASANLSAISAPNAEKSAEKTSPGVDDVLEPPAWRTTPGQWGGPSDMGQGPDDDGNEEDDADGMPAVSPAADPQRNEGARHG